MRAQAMGGQRLQEAVEWEGGWGQGLSPQGVEVHGQRPPVRGIAQHQTEPTRPCVPLPPAQSPAVSLGRVTSKAGPGDSRGACRPAGPLAAACPPVDVHAAWLPQKRTHDGLPPAPEGPLSPAVCRRCRLPPHVGSPTGAFARLTDVCCDSHHPGARGSITAFQGLTLGCGGRLLTRAHRGDSCEYRGHRALGCAAGDKHPASRAGSDLPGTCEASPSI